VCCVYDYVFFIFDFVFGYDLFFRVMGVVFLCQMLGLLDEAHAPNGIFTTYTYDGLGRLIQKFEEINSEHFISEYTYNTNGLPHTYLFPNGFSIKY
jgi:hypothetical protein